MSRARSESSSAVSGPISLTASSVPGSCPLTSFAKSHLVRGSLMTKLTHYQSWEICGASFWPGGHRHRFAGLFPVLPDLAGFCRARASTPREGQRGKVTPAKSQPLVIYDLRFEKYFANRVAKLAKRQRTPSREIFSLHRCKRCMPHIPHPCVRCSLRSLPLCAHRSLGARFAIVGKPDKGDWPLTNRIR